MCFTFWRSSWVHTFTTGRKALGTQPLKKSNKPKVKRKKKTQCIFWKHEFQIHAAAAWWDSNNLLFFAEEHHSSDSSDDEVPLLSDGTIQHDYGDCAACLEATVQIAGDNTRVFFRVRIRVTFSKLCIYCSHPAELPKPPRKQEVEEEAMELESIESHKGRTVWASSAFIRFDTHHICK